MKSIMILKINHPEAEVSCTFTESSSSSLVSGKISSKIGGESIQSSINSRKSKASSSDVLSDIPFLPHRVTRVKSRGRVRVALNSKRTVCITDDVVLEELKLKEFEKTKAEKEKESKKVEREQKRKEREEKRLVKEQGKRDRIDKQSKKGRRARKSS